jgi:hypothetical protein
VGGPRNAGPLRNLTVMVVAAGHRMQEVEVSFTLARVRARVLLSEMRASAASKL